MYLNVENLTHNPLSSEAQSIHVDKIVKVLSLKLSSMKKKSFLNPLEADQLPHLTPFEDSYFDYNHEELSPQPS